MHTHALQGNAVPIVLQDLHEPTCTPRCLGTAGRRCCTEKGSAASGPSGLASDTASCSRHAPVLQGLCGIGGPGGASHPLVAAGHRSAQRRHLPHNCTPSSLSAGWVLLDGCLVWAMAEVMAMWEHGLSLCAQNICYLWPCCVSAVIWLAVLLRTADLELHTALLQRPHCDRAFTEQYASSTGLLQRVHL